MPSSSTGTTVTGSTAQQLHVAQTEHCKALQMLSYVGLLKLLHSNSLLRYSHRLPLQWDGCGWKGLGSELLFSSFPSPFQLGIWLWDLHCLAQMWEIKSFHIVKCLSTFQLYQEPCFCQSTTFYTWHSWLTPKTKKLLHKFQKNLEEWKKISSLVTIFP